VLSDHPVSIGIAWFGSMFYPDRHGVVTFDGSVDEPIGGHQICVVGQDLKQEELIFRNSWGTGWGKDGYGRLTFAKAKELLFTYRGDVTYPILVGEV
jgi:C1A family cysteine protease